MKEFKATSAEMMASDKIQACLSTNEKSKEWKMTYDQIKRLLKKESSHYDAAILKDRESFQRAKRLFEKIDKTIDIESGVRHIAALNILIFKIHLDEDLMIERKSVKFALNKMFEF